MFTTSRPRHSDKKAFSTFDDIEREFTLSHKELVELTKAFLGEVSQGLAGYGHPMAMMCVPSSFLTHPTLKCFTAQRSLLVFQMVQRKGKVTRTFHFSFNNSSSLQHIPGPRSRRNEPVSGKSMHFYHQRCSPSR
jgi:hypothetical protein